MPHIEEDFLPKFADQGFLAVAAMNYPYVDDAIAELEDRFTFPLLMDIDSESMRVFGSALPIYPRNIVIGRDGTVVHADNASNLDAVEVAIEAALKD